MKNYQFWLLGLLVCLLIGCDSTTKLTPLDPDATILAFGDSLTYGIGVEKHASYPAVLEELTGFTVINAGISGETTSQGVKRFARTLDQYNPELVVLLEGGNDILRNHPPATIRSNLSRMIQIAQSRNIPIILIGVPEKKLFSSSAPYYSELAESHNLAFDKDILSQLLKSAKYKSDPIHLNAAGYRKFAENIEQLMRDHGAFD